jgi:hypothetical protein
VSAEYGFKVATLHDVDIDRAFAENPGTPVLVFVADKHPANYTKAKVLIVAKLEWLQLWEQQAKRFILFWPGPLGIKWGANNFKMDSEKYRGVAVSNPLPEVLDAVNKAITVAKDFKPRPRRVRVFVPEAAAVEATPNCPECGMEAKHQLAGEYFCTNSGCTREAPCL